MPRAFVLINTEIHWEKKVLKSLRDIPEVKEAHNVYGFYDIIACVETEMADELKIIENNIRTLDKVRATMTMTCIEDTEDG